MKCHNAHLCQMNFMWFRKKIERYNLQFDFLEVRNLITSLQHGTFFATWRLTGPMPQLHLLRRERISALSRLAVATCHWSVPMKPIERGWENKIIIFASVTKRNATIFNQSWLSFGYNHQLRSATTHPPRCKYRHCFVYSQAVGGCSCDLPGSAGQGNSIWRYGCTNPLI